MTILVAVIAVCVLVQTIAIVAMAIGVSRLGSRFTQIGEELRSRLLPLISNVQILVEDSRPHVTTIISNTAEITQVARTQAQRVDRVLGEALEHLRMQLVHIDQILTGTLEAVEDAGVKLQRSVLGPLVSLGALIRGVQTGVEFYRDRQQRRRDRDPFSAAPPEREQDESLFI